VKAIYNYHEEIPADGKAIDFYFGIVFSCFFFVVSLAPLLNGRGIRLWSTCVAIFLLLVSFLFPELLTPLRKLWIRFGLLIQKITQPLILGIIFYLFFTPIGVIMRCFGKDPLLLKKKSGVITCWKLRDHNQVNTDMKNQF